MQHQTLEMLKAVAEIQPNRTRPLTRNERLGRWADLLESDPARRLSTLHGTEYRPLALRETMRSAGSAISVAFEDPILREEGLADDSYGEAKRFFDLTDWQLHDIVCYCHFGDWTAASTAARGVRAAMKSAQA